MFELFYTFHTLAIFILYKLSNIRIINRIELLQAWREKYRYLV